MTKGPPSASPPALILYGIGIDRRPRAAKFSAGQTELAEKAAESLKLNVAKIESPELAELASDLPTGRVLAAGEGIVPAVPKPLFDKLLALLQPHREPAQEISTNAETSANAADAETTTAAAASEPAATAAAPKPSPTTWSEIEVGDFVLAKDDLGSDGWYEGIVLERCNGDQFKLRFRDYPEEGVVVRRRNQLGLLPLA